MLIVKILTMSRTKQVAKVVWHRATSPPRMDSSIVFASWRQYAPYIQKAKSGCNGIVH